MPKRVGGAFVALAVLVSSTASAQTPPADRLTTPTSPVATTSPADDPQVRATVTVVAQKEPADLSSLPVSATALTQDLLKAIGATFIADTAAWSPNTHFTEFTARKLSNPRIRGIGASPANAGVTTYVDGVPQFNANTSSFDLIDVGQIEFVRGPQSALFGRNALGGVINVTSARPSLTDWGGELSVPFGSASEMGVRASVSGPLQAGKLAVGLAASFGQRDGFTRDVLAGRDIDSRESIAAKGQVLWTPNAAWEARVIVAGERARDGDYALNDLAAVRSNPFEVSRDFFGHTDRDLFSTAIVARHQGPRTTFTSTTGVVRWNTFDETDLDYSFFPLATRANREEATQFTQEVRWASAAGAPVKLSDGVSLRWQTGAIAFTQGFDQNAVNNLAPFVLSPFVDFPVALTSPAAALDDRGVGIYGQGTLGFGSRVDVGVSARFDRERKNANILTAYSPMIAPEVRVIQERTFSDVSPNVSMSVRLRPGSMLFASAGRAFKAGGFNPVSLPGDEAYDEEHAWNFEGGVRTGTTNGKFAVSASVFSIDWDGLQLNLPVLGAPGQFFIDNIGGATSRGVEVELAARPTDWLDLFSAVGMTRARFSPGTLSGGVDVSGNKVPNTPAYTALVGAQYLNEFRPGRRFFARADVALTGAFEYDEANMARQDAYALTNVRAGIRARRLLVEGWVRNAFDTRYVPLAFPYQFTSSGFIAEPGRPRTFGVSVGVAF